MEQIIRLVNERTSESDKSPIEWLYTIIGLNPYLLFTHVNIHIYLPLSVCIMVCLWDIGKKSLVHLYEIYIVRRYLCQMVRNEYLFCFYQSISKGVLFNE